MLRARSATRGCGPAYDQALLIIAAHLFMHGIARSRMPLLCCPLRLPCRALRVPLDDGAKPSHITPLCYPPKVPGESSWQGFKFLISCSLLCGIGSHVVTRSRNRCIARCVLPSAGKDRAVPIHDCNTFYVKYCPPRPAIWAMSMHILRACRFATAPPPGKASALPCCCCRPGKFPAFVSQPPIFSTSTRGPRTARGAIAAIRASKEGAIPLCLCVKGKYFAARPFPWLRLRPCLSPWMPVGQPFRTAGQEALKLFYCRPGIFAAQALYVQSSSGYFCALRRSVIIGQGFPLHNPAPCGLRDLHAAFASVWRLCGAQNAFQPRQKLKRIFGKKSFSRFVIFLVSRIMQDWRKTFADRCNRKFRS